MKRVLLLLLVLAVFFKTHSQTPGNYQIEMTAITSVSNSEFKIYLVKSRDKTKLIYFKRKQKVLLYTKEDSVEYQQLINSYRKDLGANNRLTHFFEKYKAYEKDSITISSDHPLLQLSDSLANIPVLQANEKYKNRVVLDGTRVRIMIRHDHGAVKELYAVSPRKDTDPLVYQFIHDALILYRSKVENPILKKSDTSGY